MTFVVIGVLRANTHICCFEQDGRIHQYTLYNLNDATQLFDNYVKYPEVYNGTQPSR